MQCDNKGRDLFCKQRHLKRKQKGGEGRQKNESVCVRAHGGWGGACSQVRACVFIRARARARACVCVGG